MGMMAKHTYIVTYTNGDSSPVTKKVPADFLDDDGPFVSFMEEVDSSTGAGGVVFAVNADCLLTVERIS
jgi:hypothetical protein